MRLLLLFLIVLFTSCSSLQYSTWSEGDGYVIIQLEEVDPTVETYYAEITLESGRRIAVPLGKPDNENKFRIENNFGKFLMLKFIPTKRFHRLKSCSPKQDFFT